uniref:Ig-like domain-containing protein n=1 Tax=Seriola lalandi dorsalis TaxID=1841481 RepID=A0A3B4YQZ3_SERLL
SAKVIILIYTAQGVNVWPEVTGYLGHDVTLPCQLIAAKENANITQVQWDLLQPEGKSITIIVFSSQFGVNIHQPSLKERLEITEQLLLIKNVEMRDAGSYMCTIATFPLGSFEGKTNLVVRGEYVKIPNQEKVTAMTAVVVKTTLMIPHYLTTSTNAILCYWFD